MEFIFALSGWVIAAAILAIIFIFCALESALEYNYRNNGGGTWVSVITAVFFVIYFLDDHEAFKRFTGFIINYPGRIILIIVFYMLIGLVWSLAKWLLFLKKYKEYYNGWGSAGRPIAKNNSNRIITWMSYWPFSILWELIGNFFTGWFRWLYKQTSGLYDKLAAKFIGD